MRQKKILCALLILMTFLLTTMASKWFQTSFSNHYRKPTDSLANQNTVKDSIAPVLILKTNQLTIYEGDTIAYADFIEQGYDNVDGDIKEKVVYTTIDIYHAGEQTIIYTLADSSGNQTTDKIYVKVKKKVSFLTD